MKLRPGQELPSEVGDAFHWGERLSALHFSSMFRINSASQESMKTPVKPLAASQLNQ